MTSIAYLPEPVGHLVLLVAAHVEVDDGDGNEGRQRDKNHVHAEERTC